MIGEGVTDDGWFNWGNIAKYGGLGLGAMQALSYIPKLRWMRPTRWGSRAAIGTWRAGRLAPQKVQTGFRNLKIENMQITARQKVIDLQAKATYEAALGGSPNPATIRALDDAMAEAKRLGH